MHQETKLNNSRQKMSANCAGSQNLDCHAYSLKLLPYTVSIFGSVSCFWGTYCNNAVSVRCVSVYFTSLLLFIKGKDDPGNGSLT